MEQENCTTSLWGYAEPVSTYTNCVDTNANSGRGRPVLVCIDGVVTHELDLAGIFGCDPPAFRL